MLTRPTLTFVAIATALMVSVPIAQGVTIYVDNQLVDDCTSGEYSIANRDNSGSDGDAYDTIEEATDLVNAGDTIYVRSGTYVGRIDIDRSGSSGNEWTLANYSSEEVWIDGEYNNNVSEMYCIYVDGASYLKIDGINCKRASRNGIYSLLGSYVDVSNLTVTSCHGHGIGLYGDVASGGSHDWTFTNVKSYNNMSGAHLGTKSVDSAGDITFTNCEMTDGCGQGVTARWDASSANFDAQTVPDRNHQTGLWAASDSTIYICGYGGFIMKTTDSGSNWAQETVPTREVCLNAIWGSSTSDIFAVGAHGVIWRYNGSSWSAMDPGTDTHLYAVSGASSSAVWAVGWGGAIYKYNGASWSPQTSGTTNHLRGVWAVDANTVFAVGFGGKILKTTNGGTDWSSLTSGTSSNLYAIEGASSSVIWAIGASGTIRKTVNGGTDWSGQTSPYSRFLTSISVQDSSNVWIGGQSADAQTLISTSNGGSNWSDESGRVVWQTMGWPNNDVCINGIKVHSNDEVTIACGEYNENTDGVAATASHDMITFSNCKLNRNGDDGLDLYNCENSFIENCEIIDNDPSFSAAGDGNGVKQGVQEASDAICQWTVIAGNTRNGYDTPKGTSRLKNVTVYRNGFRGISACTEVYNVITWGNINLDAFLTSGTYDSIVYSTGTITGGTNLITDDPQFVDADEYDFTLEFDSPAVDAGTDLGFPYEGDGPDIGAFEYDAGTGNQAPTADAGSNDSITLPNYATLDGTISDDGLPDPPASLTTTWSKDSGPGNVTFGDASAVDTTAGFSENGVYVLQLTADDGTVTDSDTVQITVNHLAPTADAGSDDECTLPSGVTLDGTISDDGFPLSPGSVTTTWTKSSGPGTVTFGNSAAVDTTAGFSEAGAYILQLEASDGDLSDSDTVAITVNAEPGANNPPTANAGSDDSITLPSYATLDGTVSDDGLPNPPAAVTTTWSKDSGPGTVTFGDSAAVDTTAGFSVAGTYILQLTADDGTATDSDTVQIVVNEAGTGAGPFQEEGGTVVMEAENYDNNDTRTDPYAQNWALETTDTGYVGSGYMKAPIDSPLENATWANGCELGYDIDFETAGTYNIWLRRYAINSGHNSCFVGVDGTQSGPAFDNSNSGLDPAEWTWITTTACDVYISTGTHTFQIRRRERLYDIDRIILTTDGGYTPTGTGPPESPRGGNTAPTADAGSDDSITLPNYATLDGTVSDDGLPDPPASVTTTWTKDSGPGTVTFGDSSAVDTTAGFSENGVYVLKLEAGDGELSDEDTVQITVDHLAPTADAGADDECTLPSAVSLDGTISDDGFPLSPGSVTTTWSKESGPGTVTFGDASAVDTTAGFSEQGTYVLRLTADDGDKTDYDELTVTVNPSGVLMSDDFNDNDISDWTTVSGSGWDAAGGQATKLADDTVDAAIEKDGFSVSSGVLTLEFDLTVAGDWRPGNAGLVDASGNGIYLSAYVGDTYVEIGARNTTDNALTGTGGAVSDATCDPSGGITIRYEVNLDTGEVKGYVDDNLEHTETLNLSGVGAITDVVFQARKQWYLDNVVVSSSGAGPPGNTAPTADAGSNDSITLPNYATLDGTVSDDGLPDPPASVTTTWSKDSGPGNVTFGDASAVDTTAGFSENGVYVLQLLADDGTLTDSDTVQITVNHLAPTADAGSDDECTLPSGVTLDGTISDDGFPTSPGSVTTTWTKSSGPGTVTFGNSAAVDTTAGFSEAGAYILQLEASDGDLSDSDTVAITVNAEAGGTGPFQEEGGTVVMETENYDTSDQRSENNPWSEETSWAGYVGDGYMQAPGGASKTWATGSELTYEIDFSTAGTYYIWARRYADSKNENAALVGLDGTQIGGTFDDEKADYDQWIWKEHGTAVYISATQHTFNLRKEEKNYGVDRIILTDDSGYTPSGNGPAESSRQ